MMRLSADVAEIQGLAQAEAMRERPAAGIAAQWSAAHSGMGPSALGPVAQANPIPGGLAAAAVSGPALGAAMGGGSLAEEETELGEIEELGAADAAMVHGARGAQAGAMFGPWGAAIGGLAGAATGGVMGALGIEDDYGDTVSNIFSLGTQSYDYEADPSGVRRMGRLGSWG